MEETYGYYVPTKIVIQNCYSNKDIIYDTNNFSSSIVIQDNNISTNNDWDDCDALATLGEDYSISNITYSPKWNIPGDNEYWNVCTSECSSEDLENIENSCK